MNFDERTDAVRREGHALAAAARAAGVEAPVPSCPDWTVTDLVGHIGRIHRWVTKFLVEGSTDRGAHWSESAPPPPGELLDWFEAGVDPFADALHEAGPDREVWTWTPDRTSGFWARRQAVETAVHRYDAQLAANTTAPVKADLAVDGIDELLALVPYWPWADRVKGNGETLHFHCTDTDGEWLVHLEPDGFRYAREHAKGDVAARGTASNLLLYLYGRVGAGELEVFGDAALLAHWRVLVNW